MSALCGAALIPPTVSTSGRPHQRHSLCTYTLHARNTNSTGQGRLQRYGQVAASRQVAASGILDKYRAEQGAATSLASAQSVDVADNDDDECPLDCVRQIYTAEEFSKALQTASDETLVVVDFYKHACGACKYIAPGFVKLCKAINSESPAVVFLKHNIMTDDDELTDLAHDLGIKVVPMFKFYMKGVEVDAFATRDRAKLSDAIARLTGVRVL